MSVMELTKNKKYRIEIVLGYNGNKKIRHIETFYGKKSEAKAREFELGKILKNGTIFQKKNYTFKNLAQKYYDYKIDNVEMKTFVNYDYRLKHAMDRIGYVRLQELNIKILENFYQYLRQKYSLSTTTIRSYYDIINNMLEYAVKCGYILKNPNAKIDKPKKAKTEIPYYKPEEIEKLVSVLQFEPIKYQAIILLALDLGCRRGELTGLTWADVDFETGRVQINKTTQYAYGKIFEKGTKTANSERINYISKTTLELIKKWQKEQLKQKMILGSKWQGSKRIFTTDYGSDIHPDTPSKILDKIINKYGLKKITFHGLRHTNVTLMIANGIQTQIISRKVGHSSVQTTDRVYSHFFEDEFKNVPNVMEEFLTVKAN
jgi:integrase